MVLYAQLAILLIKIISHGGGKDISHTTAGTSVEVFLGIPLAAALIIRFSIRAIDADWYDRVFLKRAAPWSLIGPLYTIVVLFASEGKQVVHQVVSVVRVAAPLIGYFIVIFFITVCITRWLGFGYELAATQSFAAASNDFELAIAVAVATFGANSGEALATTIGLHIEVSVLFGLIYVV